MEPKAKSDKVWSLLGNLVLAATCGAILSLPFWMAFIAHKLDRIETIYFAVEACNAGSTMDVCRVLRGERDQ